MSENGGFIKELYGGKVRLKFVESNHAYYVAKKVKGMWGGYERKTGVTTFISIKDKSTPIKYWAIRITIAFLQQIISLGKSITKFDLQEAKVLHAKRLEQASSTGTQVHDWIEQYIKGKKPDMPEDPNVLNGVNGFLGWIKDSKAKILLSEEPVYSLKHDYCGTLDAIIKIGAKKYLLDFKTSTGIYNDVMLQTAAYVKAYEEETGDKIAGRFEVRLEKRSEEEFQAEMDEKGRVNAEYKPFEVVYLDYEPAIKDDFDAFLSFKNGYQWDKRSGKYLELCIEKNGALK